MHKRILLVIAIVAIIGGVASGDIYGVGVSFAADPFGGLPSQTMLTAKLPQLPIVWGLGATVGGTGGFNMALTGDWWLYQEPILGPISLYIGPGAYVTLPSTISLGARAPIGFNIYPIPNLELFLEFAPTLSLSFAGGDIFRFGVQSGLGFRFWLDA